MPFKRGRRGTPGWAGTALAVLLLLGTLLGVFHHHSPGDSEDGCALCALVHVVVITAPRVILPNPTLRPVEAVAIAENTPPFAPKRYTAPPRAPPSS